jgi:hypothetical protein
VVDDAHFEGPKNSSHAKTSYTVFLEWGGMGGGALAPLTLEKIRRGRSEARGKGTYI